MRIYQLLALSCNDFLDTFYIFYGHLITGIGHTGMAILLFVEHGQFPFLVWDKKNLIVNHSFCIWYARYSRNQVDRHTAIVDFYIGVRTYNRWQTNTIYIDKTIDLTSLVSHRDTFVINLEITHRDKLILKVHRKVSINVFADFLLVQEPDMHSGIFH